MVTVPAVQFAAVAPVVGPGYLAHRVAVVGYLVAVVHQAHAVLVTAALDLIPRVVGQSVAVRVLRHHDDAGLPHPTARKQPQLLLIGVAPDGKVALAGQVGDGVVEVEGDVAAVGTECHESLFVVGQPFSTLPHHVGLGVAFLVFGYVVHILPRSGPVFVYRLYIFGMYRYVVHPLRIQGQNGKKAKR